MARLGLEGERFDTYLGSANPGNMLAEIYAAARAEPLIGDHGAGVFGDAVRV